MISRLTRNFTTIAFLTLLSCVTLLFSSLSVRPATAQDPPPTCTDRSEDELGVAPATVWVDVQEHWPEWPGDHNGPFVTEVSFEDFVAGVLLGEMGPQVFPSTLPSNDDAWEYATLQAMAVAIRTSVWERINYAGQYSELVDPHPALGADGVFRCSFYDSLEQGGNQEFRPYHEDASQEIRDGYRAIVDGLTGIHIAYSGGIRPIDVQYRDTTTNNEGWTTAGGTDQLHSVYDPVSIGDTSNGSGLGQWGSQRWAMGQNDAGINFPLWPHYEQILTHYYTAIPSPK